MSVMSVIKVRLIAILFVFAALLSVGAVFKDYFVGDLFLARGIQDFRAAPIERTMEAVTLIGRGLPMVAMSVALFLWFLWRRKKPECLVAGAALLSLGIYPILKLIIERPRPAETLITVWRENSGLGFPSGHAFTAVVLFGLAFYLARHFAPGRWAVGLVRSLSAAMILLIGLSRVYLGAHWPSDVLGGFLYGAIVLTLLVHFHGIQQPQPMMARAE